MARADAHSKILAKAGIEILKPLGLFQKGRSRVWIDDQGWWIGLVEFQPSSWSKGSYLNVGVSWLWYEKDYFAHDVGDRAAAFVGYVDDVQFADEASRLARLASEKILDYRKRFRVIGDARNYLVEHANAPALWNSLYAGIACGCVGDTEMALRFFEQIRQHTPQHAWEEIVRARAGVLEGIVADREAFSVEIEKTILRARQLLKVSKREFVKLT
jgi:hypothetical protein